MNSRPLNYDTYTQTHKFTHEAVYSEAGARLEKLDQFWQGCHKTD